MATDGTASRIDCKSRAGADIRPSPCRGRLRIRAGQRGRHRHGVLSRGQLRLVHALDRSKRLLQGLDQTPRQRHNVRLFVWGHGPPRARRHLTRQGGMRPRPGACGHLPRGPSTVRCPRALTQEAYRLSSRNGLAIGPRGHAASSAPVLQGIRAILRGRLGASRMGNGLEIGLGPDDLPSDRRRLHLLRPQPCCRTIPPALTEGTRLAWDCLGCVGVVFFVPTR